MFYDFDTENIIQGEFSEEITLTKDDIELETRGIWEETYSEFNPDMGMIVMSRNPRVTLFENELLDEIPNINDLTKWILTHDNKEYTIKKPEPCGTGTLVLYLKNK